MDDVKEPLMAETLKDQASIDETIILWGVTE
jgi:hypothetical protein